ncbi:MAG: hypothetical protein K2J79_03130, partial [Ruminiclostridium sp.]|nr:hypothetical protein [Ruminiclostridium sp.]
AGYYVFNCTPKSHYNSVYLAYQAKIAKFSEFIYFAQFCEGFFMFYQQLQKACKKANTTVTATLKAIGIGTANGTYWKNGSMPSSENVIQLAEFLGVSIDYLLKGDTANDYINISEDEKELLNYYKELDDYEKGRIIGKAEELAEAARRRKAKIEAAKKAKIKSNPKAIPELEPNLSNEIRNEEEDNYIYLDFPDLPVSAGTGIYLHDDHAEQIRVPINNETLRANYALRVAGDSMEPRFYDGDIVLVETQPSVEIGEVGIFVLNDEAYIKKYGGDCLISLNSKYEDIPISSNDSFYCKGKVFAKLK